jgi:hypothetical protein
VVNKLIDTAKESNSALSDVKEDKRINFKALTLLWIKISLLSVYEICMMVGNCHLAVGYQLK